MIKMASARVAACASIAKTTVSSTGFAICRKSFLRTRQLHGTTKSAYTNLSSTCCGPSAFCHSVRHFHASGPDKKKDFYNVLGVAKGADSKAIKKAYYKLAKKYHPDMNKNDANAAKKFQEVSEAYEVLSDDGRRSDYDSFGMAGANRGFGQASPGASAGFGNYENFRGTIDPEELFRKIFGDAGFKMSGFRDFSDFEESKYGFAPASEIFLDLTFQESARGVNKELYVNVKDVCPACNGSRAAPGSKATKCPNCNGTGMETISTGPFIMQSTCRQCYGNKYIVKNPCRECNGKGKMILPKKVVVPVPAGVEDGQTVRMAVGEQEIFVTFKVAKSKIFRRIGADIHSDVAITISQAAFGGCIKIPGIYDDILLNIPAGSQSHQTISISGKGVSRVSSYGFGDHIVHIKIKIPVKLKPQQKALLLAYAEIETNTEGTINGVTLTNKEGKSQIEKQNNEDDDSFLGKIKRKIFG